MQVFFVQNVIFIYIYFVLFKRHYICNTKRIIIHQNES